MQESTGSEEHWQSQWHTQPLTGAVTATRGTSPLADHWLLIYNSGNQPQDVAVGTPTDVSIRDAELFSQFQRLIDVD